MSSSESPSPENHAGSSPAPPDVPARQPWRVFVVDDHPMVRSGFVAIINRETDFHVCGEAKNGVEALPEIARTQPDVLMTDLTMTGGNGMELIREALTLRPQLLILMVSMHPESSHGERAIRAGAKGYIMKDDNPDKLVEALRAVASGGRYVSEQLAQRLREDGTHRSSPSPDSPVSRLTVREFEIFQLMGQGLPTEAIAQRLDLSGKTVATHRANIKAKLSIGTITELTAYAAQWAGVRYPA